MAARAAAVQHLPARHATEHHGTPAVPRRCIAWLPLQVRAAVLLSTFLIWGVPLQVRQVDLADAAQPALGRRIRALGAPPSILQSTCREGGCGHAVLHSAMLCCAVAWQVWPVWGLQPIYWGLVWASIDRRDECADQPNPSRVPHPRVVCCPLPRRPPLRMTSRYQLVSFILEFKALMFISIGLVCLLIGSIAQHSIA